MTAEEQRVMDMKLADERAVLKGLLQIKFKVEGSELYEPWEVPHLNKEKVALSSKKKDSTITREEGFKLENIVLAQIRGCQLPSRLWVSSASFCENARYGERMATYDRKKMMHGKLLMIHKEDGEDGERAVVRDMSGDIIKGYPAEQLPPPGTKHNQAWKQFGDDLLKEQSDSDVSVIDMRTPEQLAVYHSYK